MKKYWAIDPGPTPGMASVSTDLSGFETFQCDDVDTCLGVLWDICSDGSVAGIAMEDFFLSRNSRPMTPGGSKITMEVIGAIKFICEYHNIPLWMQTPVDAKSFSSNDKLRKIGWETPSNPDHQRSAARHLLLCCTRLRVIDPLSLIP